MAYGYTKLFGGDLLQSSVWQEDLHVKVVWIAMLSLTNEKGIVEASVPGLARSAGVTISQCEEALAKFLAPDKYSRTKDHEGRRIKEVDGGWHLLNHAKYRAKLDAADQRAKATERMRKHRAKNANGDDGDVTDPNANVTSGPRDDGDVTVRHTDPDPDPDPGDQDASEGGSLDQAPLSPEPDRSAPAIVRAEREVAPPGEPPPGERFPMSKGWEPEHEPDLEEDCRVLGIDLAEQLRRLRNRNEERDDWQARWREWLSYAIEFARKNRKPAQASPAQAAANSAAIAARNRAEAERARALIAENARKAAADLADVARVAQAALEGMKDPRKAAG